MALNCITNTIASSLSDFKVGSLVYPCSLFKALENVFTKTQAAHMLSMTDNRQTGKKETGTHSFVKAKMYSG